MTNGHVVSVLRLKRAEISGHIHDLEKRVARQRANLANLDATIKLCPNPHNEDCEIEIRQIFEAEDFGAALTPELRSQEERLRAQAGKRAKAAKQ
jgi:hypothetical protein